MNIFYIPPPRPEDIFHYGIKRKSGRYPWGSGERPYQSINDGNESRTKKLVSSDEYRAIGAKAKERKKQGVHIKDKIPVPKETSSERPYQSEEKNAPEIKNYKGKAYFVSTEDMDGKTLNPRVPDNFFTKNGYEDNTTKRISFAPSIDKCLLGLSQNLTGKTFHVYEPKKIDRIYKPNTNAVPDSSITDELWIKEPTTIKKVCTIKVTKDSGRDGLKFKYGDGKEAELYEWDYEIINEKDVKHAEEGGVNFKMNKFYSLPSRPEDIYHYGIKRKSGRYPWGSGDRPYQGTQSSGGLSGYLRDRKRKKQEAAAAKEQANKARTAEQESAERERILREGSAAEVMTLRGKVTNQELQQAVTRLNLEAQLKSMSAKEFKSTMSKIDTVMKDVKMGTEWAKIGIDTYNTLAKIYNATEEGKKDPWPMIGEGKKDKKKDKDND